MSILVTGASGFLGTKLVETLTPAYQVAGTYHTSETAVATYNLDLRSSESIETVLTTVQPETVVHNAAMVDVSACESRKDAAWETNVEATTQFAEHCREMDAQLVYISSDYVFDGESGPYFPDSLAQPVNFYGATKLIGENIVQNQVPDGAVVRPTIMYGYNGPNDKKTFVSRIIEELQAKKPLQADNNRQKYPVLIDDVATLVRSIIDESATSIFHASGDNGMTRYEWGREIAAVFDLDESLLEPCVNDHTVDRPYDVDLKSPRAESLNVSFASVTEGLQEMKRQLEA